MPRYRVLIVDDQRDIRRVLSMGLSTLGMKIDVVDVPSAEEAMLVATHGAFDLMVSDVRLPGMSGLELVRRVQKLHPAMKIILMTGMTDAGVRQQVEAAGAEAFFYKPIEMDAFLEAVSRSLGAGAVRASEAEPQATTPTQDKTLTLIDCLEDLRRRAVLGLAAILNTRGEVVAQAGFLSNVYQQPGLAAGLKDLYLAGLAVSQNLQRSEPEAFFYLAGKTHHFYITSLNHEHLLVLTAEQPFQNQLPALQQWLPESVKALDQILSGRALVLGAADQGMVEVETRVGEAEPPPAAEEMLFPPLEEELAEADVSDEDRAAIEALLNQAGKQKMKKNELDDFWDTLAEESGSLNLSDGSISYDQARDLGLTPE